MHKNLELILEDRTQKLIKRVIWKIEPYLSKILFFLSIGFFFIENLILKLNYSLLFNPELQGRTGLFAPIVLLGAFYGMFIVFPLYSYFKFIYNKLGPKSTQAYEIFVSISLLITNYLLSIIKSPELYLYIYLIGAMSICLIGSIFLASNEEKVEGLIDEAVNPSKTYQTIMEHYKNQLNHNLKMMGQIQNEITKLLMTSDHTESNKVHSLIDKNVEIIEGCIFLKEKVEKIHDFYEENKSEYSSKEICSKDFSEYEEELILRAKYNKIEGLIGLFYIIGFFLLLFGCAIIFMAYFGPPPNAPIWISYILISLGLILWIYGHHHRKRTLHYEIQLKNINNSQKSEDLPNQEESHALIK
jgi:hypothetical protein